MRMPIFRTLAVSLIAVGCGGGDSAEPLADGGTRADAATGMDAGTDAGGASSTDGGSFVSACTGTGAANIVCAANEFLAVLPSATKTAVNLQYSDFVSRTLWSNLPGPTRAGVKVGLMDATSAAAALSLMAKVLSSDGDTVLVGIRNADDYLNSLGGGAGGGGIGDGGTDGMGGLGGSPGGDGGTGGLGGPPGGDGGMGGLGGLGGGSSDGGASTGTTYGAANYSIAIFGTPSLTGNWALSFGGHHMAFNLTWHAGIGYATPNHLGVEPKAAFTINGQSFQPLGPAGDAFFAVFKGLSSSDLTSAFIGGTFSDVLIGPVEYQTGSTTAVKAKYPTGANRLGIKVSDLSSDEQALVLAAIGKWVNNYDSSISAQLLADYTTSDALADTLIGWSGTQSSGVDPDVNGTYLRIDGPRLWLELSCQAGVVIQNVSHFHTIYRDKQYDYAADF